MAKQCSICGKQFGRFESSDGMFGVLEMCNSCVAEVKRISALASAKDYAAYFQAKAAFSEKHKNSPSIEKLLKNMDNAYDIKDEGKYIADQREKDEAYKMLLKIRDFPVTTTDISLPYDVIGPIIVNTTNKGVFSSAYSKLLSRYSTYPMNALLKKPSTESEKSGEFGTFFLSLFDTSLAFEGAIGQGSFDMAYYICVAELKLRCAEMGGNAIVGMHMDFDLDTTNWGGFYIQMHGTAVKLKDN